MLVDRDQNPVTEGVRVRFEVATTANLGTIAFTLPHSLTASGVVTTAIHDGGGVYSTHIRGLINPEMAIGVAVLVDVLAPNGSVVNTVAFIESPILDAAGTFRPYLTFDVPGAAPQTDCCS